MLKKQWPTSQERERLSVCRLYTRRLCSDSAQRTSTQASACASAHPFAQARPVQSLSGEQVGSSAACHLYHVDYDHAPVAQSLGASVPLRATRRYHASDEVSSHRPASVRGGAAFAQARRQCTRASASCCRVGFPAQARSAGQRRKRTSQPHPSRHPLRHDRPALRLWFAPVHASAPREARMGTPLTRFGLL